MDLPQSRNARVRGQFNNQPVKFTGVPLIEDPNGPNRHIQDAYQNMRARGESHSMAEMLAYRQSPSANTDREFQMHGTLDKQIGDPENIYLNEVTSNYRKATGQNPNPNHLYVQSLAQYPGDPRAFVADRGDVKRRAEELNVSVSGAVNHTASEPRVDPFKTTMKDTTRAPIANDLKQMITDAIVKKNPEMKGRVNQRMLDETHGNHVKKA